MGGLGRLEAAPVPRASEVVHLSSRMDESSFCCPEDPCDVPSQARGFPVCQIKGSARSEFGILGLGNITFKGGHELRWLPCFVPGFFFFFQVNKKDCIFSARWICFCHMVFSVPNELLTSCQLSTQIRRDGGRRVLYQSLPKLQTAAREPHSLGFDPMPPLAHMGGKVVIRLG